ncbi:MAG: PilN domain-containing protein, partial [Bacteroidota bacterium]
PATSLIVRAGIEDTLVMFLRGEAPMFIERLRSLTSIDAPETICSRVLLQQDEYGIGEVHHVFVLSADRESALVESFEMFFPDATVERLADHVPMPSGGFPSSDSNRTLVPASAAGVRLLDVPRYAGAFEPVNLVMRRHTRRAPRLPFTWHVAAMALLLFVSVFFFGIRFASQQYTITEYEAKLREYPPQIIDTDVRALQARIDSLRGTSARYLRALDVLDTLMVGSDRWSRALEQTSNGTAAVSGIWVDSWRPVGTTKVRLNGNATSRDRVVRLAEKMEGHIEALTFNEIREWPVYSFVIDIPLHDDLPEAAEYLRQQVVVTGETAPEEKLDAETASSGAPVRRTSLSPRP